VKIQVNKARHQLFYEERWIPRAEKRIRRSKTSGSPPAFKEESWKQGPKKGQSYSTVWHRR